MARDRPGHEGSGVEGQQQALCGAGCAGGAGQPVRSDSRVMRTQGMPPRQAYNAQAAVNDQQIILAAEITTDAPDFGHLEPMLDRTLQTLARHGVSEPPGAVVADAGYWHTTQSRRSLTAGSRFWSRPTAPCARGSARAGRTGSMTRCATGSAPS